MLSRARTVIASTSRLLKESARASLDGIAHRPVNAILFVTYRCTSRCVGCNMWHTPGDVAGELTSEEWLGALGKLLDAGIEKVEFFGGDALLRKDALLPMIRLCRERRVLSFFTTNSLGMTERTARDLVGAGLDVLYISLDEVPDINGSVRGIERHFERARRAIDWVRAARGVGRSPRIECVTTVSAANWRYVARLLEFSSSRDVSSHHLRAMSEFTPEMVAASAVEGIAPNPYFMPTDSGSRRFSEAEAREFVAMVESVRRNSWRYEPMQINTETVEHLRIEDLVGLTYPRQKCLFCTNDVVVSPFGDVMPCVYFREYRLGNLRDAPLATLWGAERHRRFTTLQRSGRIPLCDGCSMKTVHRTFTATLGNEVRRIAGRVLGRGTQEVVRDPVP